MPGTHYLGFKAVYKWPLAWLCHLTKVMFDRLMDASCGCRAYGLQRAIEVPGAVNNIAFQRRCSGVIFEKTNAEACAFRAANDDGVEANSVIVAYLEGGPDRVGVLASHGQVPAPQ